jgi:hypothetical protein
MKRTLAIEEMTDMKVVSIAGQADPRTLEILAELTKLAQAGQLAGFAYIAEVRGEPIPKYGTLGRYLADPFLGMGAVNRLWFKLSRTAEAQERALTGTRR